MKAKYLCSSTSKLKAALSAFKIQIKYIELSLSLEGGDTISVAWILSKVCASCSRARTFTQLAQALLCSQPLPLALQLWKLSEADTPRTHPLLTSPLSRDHHPETAGGSSVNTPGTCQLPRVNNTGTIKTNKKYHSEKGSTSAAVASVTGAGRGFLGALYWRANYTGTLRARQKRAEPNSRKGNQVGRLFYWVKR